MPRTKTIRKRLGGTLNRGTHHGVSSSRLFVLEICERTDSFANPLGTRQRQEKRDPAQRAAWREPDRTQPPPSVAALFQGLSTPIEKAQSPTTS